MGKYLDLYDVTAGNPVAEQELAEMRERMAALETALAQWRARMALSQRAAAEALGASFRTYQQWESGISRQTGKPIDPPLTALLAAAARENGLPPIS